MGRPEPRDGQAQVENLCSWGSPELGQTRVDTPCMCHVEQNEGVAPEITDLPPAGNPETMGRDSRIPASDAHDCT